MYVDEFHSSVATACAACGRRFNESDNDREVVGTTRNRTCPRCRASGFRFNDDTDISTNQVRA